MTTASKHHLPVATDLVQRDTTPEPAKFRGNRTPMFFGLCYVTGSATIYHADRPNIKGKCLEWFPHTVVIYGVGIVGAPLFTIPAK